MNWKNMNVENINWENINYAILIVGVMVAAIILSTLLRKALSLFITKYAKKLNANPTNFSFLKNSVSFIIYSLAVIFIFIKIPYLNTLGNAMFAGAGILVAIIGLASQKAFTNIFSGLFILIFKPFRIDDIIEFGSNQKGIVEEITLRHTIIRDYENRRIIIPNSTISDEIIINSSIADEKIKKHIEFGISYDSSIDKAIEIIKDEAVKHPYFIDVRNENEIIEGIPSVVVRVISHSDFAINLKAYVWTSNNDNAFVLKCDLLKSVKERFDKEGIEIPFPYRTIVYKNDIEKGKVIEK